MQRREVNTIGSKAQDSEISHRVIDIKSELEKNQGSRSKT